MKVSCLARKGICTLSNRFHLRIKAFLLFSFPPHYISMKYVCQVKIRQYAQLFCVYLNFYSNKTETARLADYICGPFAGISNDKLRRYNLLFWNALFLDSLDGDVNQCCAHLDIVVIDSCQLWRRNLR